MMSCKQFLKVSYLAVQKPDVDPEQRWSLVLLRATMLAVPFWRRERVWSRMTLFLNWIDEPDEEAEQNVLD